MPRPPPPSAASSDWKGVLTDLRIECSAAAIRQEEFFTKLLDKQRLFQEELFFRGSAVAIRQEEFFKQFQEELSAMRSMAKVHAKAQDTLKRRQEDMLVEIRCKSLVKDVAPASEENLEATGVLEAAADGEAYLKDVTQDVQKDSSKKVSVDLESSHNTEKSSSSQNPVASQSSLSSCLSQKTSGQNTVAPRSSRANFSQKATEVTRNMRKSVKAVLSSRSSKKLKCARLVFEEQELGDVDDQSLKARLDRALRCRDFDIAIAFAVLCNALIMFWEGQYEGLDVGLKLQFPTRQKEARTVWAGAETAFAVFYWFFGLVFLLECIMKNCCWRQNYFRDRWNLLDFLCVVEFVFARMAENTGFKPQMTRLLRLFRLARIVRLIRFLDSLDHLYIMTTTVAGLSTILVWAALLITTMLLAFDLFLVELLHSTYFSEVTAHDLTEDQLKKHHEMYQYFGTCSRCMLSMFEITLGNWPPIVRLLSEEVSEWFTPVCLLLITIGFAVVGVVTGVIIQETFKVAQTDDIIMLRQKKRTADVLRSKMGSLFDTLDEDGDGALEMDEFVKCCEDPNMKLWLESLDIETDDLESLFRLVDSDQSGSISLEEIVERLPRIKGNARSIDVLAIRECLRI